MKRKSLTTAAKWLVGVIIYLALSIAVSSIFVFVIQRWPHEGSVSRFTELEIRLLWRPIFAICILCGALYASAFAKPECFGQIPRILKHLGWSYILSILGCVLPIRIVLLPLPNFPSMSSVSAFIVAGLTVSVLCFVAAIAVWVHLSFGRNHILTQATAEE